MEGGRGGGDAGLGAALAEHLVELGLEDDGVGGAGLLAGRLEAGEHVLEVVDAGLGAGAELLVPRRPHRRRRRPAAAFLVPIDWRGAEWMEPRPRVGLVGLFLLLLLLLLLCATRERDARLLCVLF